MWLYRERSYFDHYLLLYKENKITKYYQTVKLSCVLNQPLFILCIQMPCMKQKHVLPSIILSCTSSSIRMRLYIKGGFDKKYIFIFPLWPINLNIYVSVQTWCFLSPLHCCKSDMVCFSFPKGKDNRNGR